jgi:hypothetical protein
MKRFFSLLLGGLLLSATLTAWAAGDRTGPPIISWQPPATFSLPHAAGRTALTDISGPLPLVPMVPCRQYSSVGTPLLNATPRAVTVTGAPCGVLSNSFAIAVNITVFNIAATANAVFRVGTSSPPTTAWINYPPTEVQRANAGVMATNGTSIFVQVDQGSGQVDFVVDIYGYYPLQDSGHVLNAGEYFEIATNIAPPFASINARNNSTAAGAIALQGIAGGATGNTIAILGTNGSSGAASVGVSGIATNGVGVKGLSTNNNGVVAQATNWDGLFAQGGRHGTFSASSATTGVTFGVVGFTASTTATAAGVWGEDSSDYLPPTGSTVGVLGTSQTGYAVLGQSRYISVYGQLRNSSDVSTAAGMLGTTAGTAADSTTGPWGVFSFGNFGATGTKHFVEPHPTDPKKDILYTSLEGREVGTYFRGTASIVNHEAVIVIPEDFRMVTDEEGLTVQVTPIGAYSQVYVESKDLNQIVIRGSRDVPFDYMVNSVRRAFKNFEPVQTGYIFMPQSPSDRMPAYLTEEAKARLISNGTYNPDGTVNMTTAERAGFTKIWADREAEAKAAANNAKAGQQR